MELEEVEVGTISPEAFAKETGLRYITDNKPGFGRIKKKDAYIYIDIANKEITDQKVIDRITKLRIPHVWENVWICPTANGHLQATGFDSKNRKQYRYHEKWQSARNLNKFSKMLPFGKKLSQLRQQIDRDLEEKQFTRNKILAVVVSLLDNTLIRIGNKCYEKANKSYGLTTLRDKHIKVQGKDVKISFVGKKSVCQEVTLTDRRLATLVRKCKEIPGHELFQYYDTEGNRHPVSSEDVNGYLREYTGIDLTAKDFRTWGGSITAIQHLLAEPRPEAEKEIQKKITETVKLVASKLGNTAAVCRNYYIHPLVLESYASGDLEKIAANKGNTRNKEFQELGDDEIVFLKLLEEVAEQ
jgi:DNA topoisomerase-1